MAEVPVFVAAFIGAMLVYFFSSLASARAHRPVDHRRGPPQFREMPGS
jgi:Na+/H+-translocating membrane pyrophosphatase